MIDLGDYKANSTVRAFWATNAVAGESITRATNGTLRIYKNLTTTERASASGVTDTEDFDTLTGVHAFSIDLSDNTDAGFYAAGNDYFVVLAGATIDGKSINYPIAKFSIENREYRADVLKNNGTAITSSAGRQEVNTTHVAGTAQTAKDLGEINVTNLNTLSGHDPGATLGTSTLTQAQVTGGAYSMQSASCVLGDARIANLDATVSSRAAAALFTGITSVAQWLGLMAGKQTGNSTARTELRATGAGSGTFDETTDSIEAIRDRGDAAWTTATGFSTLDAAGVRSAVGLASANLDTQLDAIPTAAENRAEMDSNSTKLADILTDTAEIGVAGAGLTNIDLPDQTMNIVGNITGNLSGSVGSVTAAVSTTSNVKKNQALSNFTFLMTDDTNHEPMTGLTVAVTRKLDNGSFGAGTLSAVMEVGNGLYAVDFGAGDLNGDVVTLRATATGADDTYERLVTQP